MTYRCERDVGVVIGFGERVRRQQTMVQEYYRDVDNSTSTASGRRRHRDCTDATENRKSRSSSFYIPIAVGAAGAARDKAARPCILDPSRTRLDGEVESNTIVHVRRAGRYDRMHLFSSSAGLDDTRLQR